MNELQLKLERQRLLEQKLLYKKNLPHLYGFKWYKWGREFFESRNHYNFIVAANQIGKSTCLIRKAIHWATDKELWPHLWRHDPLQFWYLYPTKDVATIEFQKKWKPLFLPRKEMKDHPTYGWREEIKHKQIHAVHFHSGVSIYFKTYAQDASDLQTGSVDFIGTDEELPEVLYSELNMRIAATDGYYHGVFTATLGQEMWRLTMEETGKDELFKGAFKRQISMYDCLHYEDGTPSHWTEERIQRLKNSCKSEAEIQRRIYGRFVVDGNVKYPSFTRKRNINREIKPTPSWWLYYTGTDIGSGGNDGHPAAIVVIAVRPDYRYGRVIRGWRGDGVLTTAGDVVQKHEELTKDLHISGAFYDWQCKDFHTIASRMGKTFTPAEKSHEIGESILNVLFKNQMLDIDDIPELRPLVIELVSLKADTPKTRAKDDFVDSARYCAAKIPWDFNAITGEKIDLPPENTRSAEERARRGEDDQSLEDQLSVFDPDVELDGWNEMMES